MHRNGIQLSGTTARIMDKDPRPIVASLGIEVLEIPSLHDRRELFARVRRGLRAGAGRQADVDLSRSAVPQTPSRSRDFGVRYGIVDEAEQFCGEAQGGDRHADADSRIADELSRSARDARVPVLRQRAARRRGASRRRHEGARSCRGAREPDAAADGGGNSGARATAPAAEADRGRRRRGPPRDRRTWCCRPTTSPGIALPGTDKPVSARAGSEAAYVAVAKKYPVAVLLRVVRSQSVDQARQGRGARAARTRRSR